MSSTRPKLLIMSSNATVADSIISQWRPLSLSLWQRQALELNRSWRVLT